MKNVMKNIVLCLFGIVLMATLMTNVAAVGSALGINTGATINEHDDVLEITFTITNMDATNIDDDYTVTATSTDDILKTDVELDAFNIVSIAGTTVEHTVDIPVDTDKLVAGQTYTVTVDITGALVGALADNQIVSVYVTGETTPSAQHILTDIDFDDETYPEGTVDLEVTLEVEEDDPNVKYEDVTIEAWIEDADGDRLTEKDETSEFNIGKFDDDDEKTKILSLDIPENADEGEYYVVVVVNGEFDGRKGLLAYDNTEEITVERNDHSVKVLFFQFDEEVEAGDSADFALGLLNNGREDETVNVKINIVGLDASQTSGDIEIQVDEYAPAYFSMNIPEDADEDDYTVKVTVYNDEIEFTRSYSLTVEEDTGYVATVGGLVIGADATSKQIEAAGGVYLITLTNNDANANTYTMDVTGASTWADYSINPGAVTVNPGTSEIVSVYLSPNADADGTNTFTVNVKEGATVVDSIGLTAQVSESNDAVSLLTTGLQWLVAALIVIAIVLGVAWACCKNCKLRK